MNLIYMCVFHQESYIHLLELLVKTISVNGNIKDTDILIITSPSFQPLIQTLLDKYELSVFYYLHTLFDAGCSRLNIFNYENINAYDKILYLDTDILINSDMNKLFDLDLSPKKLYALEEGYIGESVFNWWGHDFFDFTKYKKDTPAFTTGILLFKNSESMKGLFEKIQLHIKDYVGKNDKMPCGLDQPFIVYNAITENKYDNHILKSYVENNPSSVSPEKIVYHFPGDPGSYDTKMEKMTSFLNSMTEFNFITLSSSGYIKFTLNCLRSLKKLNMNLHSYVVGKEGYTILKEKGYNCTLIDDESISNFHHYNCKTWGDITFQKFNIIYTNLLKYKYVLFTDGDIVFEKPFLDYLKSMGDYDMIIQSEGNWDKALCSGFMYIKSSETTLSLFNPSNVEKHKMKHTKWNDQLYLNDVASQMHYKKLPLDLFPNGRHYYNHKVESPYLIHFNWLIGDEKETKMRHYGKWYENATICHHSNDGFGHQLEGMLRLISLSLNDKADYAYDFKKTFLFEHKNLNSSTLTSYFLKALELLKPKNYINKSNVVYENKSFNETKSETVYCYDGVSTGDLSNPNFEHMNDTKKTLPLLRKAFVLDNPFFPKPSYNTPHVVCHIRLGDAVGTRNLDNTNIFNFIKKMQPDNKILIHSDGDVSFLKSENTTICDKNTDVLQILSDFVHADVLLINYSSLSMAAHLLASETQEVFCPNFADHLFFKRILSKCKKINKDIKFLNKTYSWEQCSITFLEGGLIDAFGGGTFTQLSKFELESRFGGRIHNIVFNEDYTEFVSTRRDDGCIVNGKLI